MDKIGFVRIFLSIIFLVYLECSPFNQTEEDIQMQTQIIALHEFINIHMVTKQPAGAPQRINTSGFPNFKVFQELSDRIKFKSQVTGICSACNVGLGYIMFQVRTLKISLQDMIRKSVFICEFFKISTSEVCNGLIERYSPTIYYIIIMNRALTPNGFCGVMLQSYGCNTSDPILEWTVDIPVRNVSFDSIWKKRNFNGTRSDVIKIAQLADPHADPLYVPGTNAECDNKILCCEERNGRPMNQSLQAAGQFGDSRKCDPPYSTLILALKNMEKEHSDVQLFYMTGDIVPHNIWSTTQEDNTKAIKTNTEIILKYYPTMKIIPVIGNHEPHPVNFFSPHGVPDDISTTWIYNVTYEVYKQWIPEDQKDIYLQHGYYSIEINSKFRILVINSNFCYGFNVWQMYEIKDPGNQLKWLIEELQNSEMNHQTVHIVGHVPPTHDECSRVWSRNFYNIMLRYHHIITGQFYGHTHFDEFKLLYHDGVPINVIWIAPSLTMYDIKNPAYRIYLAQQDNYQIIDHETWIFDLEQANLNPEETPTWFRLYSAVSTYGISDLTPTNLGKLIELLAQDESIFSLFYQHYHKISDANERLPCDNFCRKHLLCGFVKSYFGDEKECIRVYALMDSTPTIFQILINFFL